ncbi:hypothetical protein AB4K20DRAFT_1912583 [Rhizopus microsporus]
MNRVIQYGLHAYRMYRKLPILVTICIERVSLNSLMDTFNSFMRCFVHFGQINAFFPFGIHHARLHK